MKFFKNLTIKTQLIINALLTCLVVILIIFLSYLRASSIIVNKNRDYTNVITSNIQYNIALYYQEASSILNNIAYDPNTHEYITENDPIKGYEISKKLKIISINMMNIKKDILDIVIIGENGRSFTMNGEDDIVKKLKTSIPDDGRIYNTGFEVMEGIGHSGEPIISFIYGMHIYSAYNEETFGSKIGFAAVIMDLRPIFKEINKFSANTDIKFYLIDKKGNPLSISDPLKINYNANIIKSITSKMDISSNSQRVTEINGMRYIVQIYDVPQIEGKIVSFVSEKELFSEILEVRKMVLGIFVIAILLLSLLFSFIIRNITQPVKKLIAFMNSVKSGNTKNLKKRIELEGYLEIKVLSQEFNSMMGEINNLTNRLFETTSKLYEAEIEKKEAELAYLRSQINPHFLYNTLEAMKGIALEEGVDRIFEMTKSLALVFRYSVHGSNTVMLNEELKIIKAYIKIHVIRFGDRLEAIYDFAEHMQNIRVLKMMLQPIIENAIFHGLEPKRGKGRLWVGSKIIGDDLLIWVKDDGVGIDSERLEGIRKHLSEPSMLGRQEVEVDNSKGKGSIGLHNVNNRIKLTYGDKYGVDITSEKGKGTEVIVTIPIEEEDYV